MSANPVWMPLYVDDYAGATARLTCEQHGAYMLLIMDYWRNGPPPDDDDVLMQIVKLDRAKWRKHRPLISTMFHIVDGRWTHKRIDRELAKSGEITEKRRAASNARWDRERSSKSDANAHANSDAHAKQTTMQTASQPQPQPQEKVRKETSPQEAAREQNEPLPHGALAFSGGVVRVNRREFDAWAKTYHGIPDLHATLTALDEWIVEAATSDHTVTQRWRRMVTGQLDKKHQAWLAEMRKGDDDCAFTGPC